MNRIKTIKAIFLSSLSMFAATECIAQGARQEAEIIVPTSSQHSYETWGFAPAVRIENTIYVSGVISGLEGQGTYEERYARGFITALKSIENILNEAGASLDDVVEFTTFHTDLQRQLQTAIRVRMENMNEPHPAWTAVGTTALASPDGMTEIKVIAHLSD